MHIGQKIKARRLALKITLLELEKRTGINNGNLSKIENGKLGYSQDSIEKISTALGVTKSQLFSDDPIPTDDIIFAPNGDPGHVYQNVASFGTLKDLPPGVVVSVPAAIVDPSTSSPHPAWRHDPSAIHVFMTEDLKPLSSRPQDLASITIPDHGIDRFYPGDRVVVDTVNITPPVAGGMFALILDGTQIVVRRLFPRPGAGLMITADNPKFPTMTLTSAEVAHICIVGRVVALRSTSGF